MSPKRLRDIDAAERAHRLQALAWGLAVGGLMGSALGGWIASVRGWSPFIGAPAGFLVIAGAVYFLALRISDSAKDLAQEIYNPSGSSTPYQQQYSYAASLAVRGRFAEAAAAYQLHVIENPSEPQPYLELARLCRDRLKQFDDALAWFRRARTDATLGPGQELYVIQEIIDLYTRQLRTPRKAIPELTLVCQRFPGTPAARAAEQQLIEMRDMLARERDGIEPFTAQFLKELDRASARDAAREVLKELSGENPASP